MEGYIGLYRCLLEKPIWKQSTPEQKAILITILLMVNYKEAEWEWKGEKYHAKPGQTVTSLEQIAEAAGKGISIQNVRSALLRFEKLGFLTNESTKTGRLVTVLNWELYQVELKLGNKDTNKEVTKSQQRGNKEVTTNNKDNKDNKNNKIKYAEFVSMTEEEYQKLLNDYGQVVIDSKITDLSLWKGSKGKKTKSDYLTLLTWLRKDNVQKTQEQRANAGAYRVIGL